MRQRIVKQLSAEMADVDSFVVFTYEKLTAQQAYNLRKTLHEKNIQMKVVKNTLAALSFSQLYQNSMEGMLKGPTAIAYGGETPVDVAKALLEWNKKEKVLNIKGGCLSKKALNKEQVEALSKIPPKPVLLSALAGAFTSPMSKIATIIVAPVQELSNAFRALIDKKEKEQAAN
jgi:large subunit ribosomal protein L10